jgi:hypothetical protein
MHADRALDADRDLYQVFGGYRGKRFRLGAHYTRQHREAARNTTSRDVDIDIISGFAIWDVKREKVSVFGRVDRFDDPSPSGASVAYLPFDPRAPFTFTVAGFEWYLHPRVRISPNVEWATYDDLPNGTPIQDDVVARVTFYWVFP